MVVTRAFAVLEANRLGVPVHIEGNRVFIHDRDFVANEKTQKYLREFADNWEYSLHEFAWELK